MMLKDVGRILPSLFVYLLFAVSLTHAQTTYYPATGVFNGFLNQVNIVECDNSNETAVSMSLQAVFSSGDIAATREFTISPLGSVHTILNDIANITNNHGTYTLNILRGGNLLGDKISCRTAVYRYAASGAAKPFEYFYVLPVRNPQFGTLGGIYNSFDPSQQGFPTANWLSVINLGKSNFNADVEVFDLAGNLVQTHPLTDLAPNKRVDIALGHPRGQVAGIYRVVPAQSTQLYDAMLMRYNSAPGGRYSFAFPLRALPGSCSGDPMQASTMGNGLTDNWLEVANIGDLDVDATVEVRDRDGNVLDVLDQRIAPLSQSHFFLSPIIDAPRTGNVGSVRVLCDDPNNRLIVQSAFYGRLVNAPGVEWAYSTQAALTASVNENAELTLPFNTFLGMANWVKLAESALDRTALAYTVYDQAGRELAVGEERLPAGGTSDIGVHAMVAPNTVGSIRIAPNQSLAQFAGEMLRVTPRIDGQIGGIMYIPGIVQQQGVAGRDHTGFLGDPQSLAPYRDVWTSAEARHLLTRAAFGASVEEVENAVEGGLSDTLADLFRYQNSARLDAEVLDWLDSYLDGQTSKISSSGMRKGWMHRLLYTPNPLYEKMGLVWHDLLATSCRVLGSSEYHYCHKHVETLRRHALGNFRTLINEITTDYVMLKWLNGNRNKAGSPDENFARELWELFILGEASKHQGRYPLYTSADISQSARALTGWSTRYLDGEYVKVFVQDFHDSGEKTLWSGTPHEVSGNFDYQDIPNLTLDRNLDAARFISRRLFCVFVHDHPSPAIVNQLASMLKQSDWNVKPLVRTILNSEAMFSLDARHSRIKDPITYFIGFLRSTKIPVDTGYLTYKFPYLGMDLTNPDSVEGWPINKYKQAHESDYFLAFYPQYVNVINDAIRRIKYHDEEYTLDALLPSNRPTAGEAVDHISYLLGVSLSRSERDDLIQYMDNKMGYQGIEPELFDAREPSQVRRKIAGLLWILVQHEDYMTY